MGFRFRKSIKIAPGVRLNIGKKSASISVGGRGVRHTISSTGRRTSSISIPGTGISYTKSHYTKPKSKSHLTNTQDYVDPFQEVTDFNNYIEQITSFHKECDYEYDWESIVKEPEPFKVGEKGPNEVAALEKLNKYEPNILVKVFKTLEDKRRKELEEEVKKAIEEDKKLYQFWEKQRNTALSILQKDPNAYMTLLKDINFCNELAGFIDSLEFEAPDGVTMIIECNINIDDIIPTHYWNVTKTGKLSKRKYSMTDYYSIIKWYVSSLAIRIARNIFGLLPIKTVIINNQTNVLDAQVGRIDNITILSVKIDKATLEKLNFDLIDPFDALNNFEHNVKFLKTRGFQPVERLV